jgi:hypothetical protein
MRKSSTLLSNPFDRPSNGACGACRFPSQVLSDVVESLVGAVYVDSRGDLDTAWAVAQVCCRHTALTVSAPCCVARNSQPRGLPGIPAGLIGPPLPASCRCV